jgi:hypothetical protein
MPLFRQRARECYFCLSPEDMSKTQASSSRANNDRLYGPGLAGADVWRCRACKCWNVRDRNGVIVSDLPAMHNPSLNLESAALRGEYQWWYLEGVRADALPLVIVSCYVRWRTHSSFHAFRPRLMFNERLPLLASPGRPASNRLPPSAAAPRFMPFCRNCLTNQTLVMNLLSNYLPDESVCHPPHALYLF